MFPFLYLLLCFSVKSTLLFLFCYLLFYFDSSLSMFTFAYPAPLVRLWLLCFPDILTMPKSPPVYLNPQFVSVLCCVFTHAVCVSLGLFVSCLQSVCSCSALLCFLLLCQLWANKSCVFECGLSHESCTGVHVLPATKRSHDFSFTESTLQI